MNRYRVLEVKHEIDSGPNWIILYFSYYETLSVKGEIVNRSKKKTIPFMRELGIKFLKSLMLSKKWALRAYPRKADNDKFALYIFTKTDWR